jgi:uncharacterized protein YodC (DUF2158 family)
MAQFKVGDFVILRDGGQPMKVARVGTDPQGHLQVNCTWFAAGLSQAGEFRPGQLRAYAPELPDVANPPLGS